MEQLEELEFTGNFNRKNEMQQGEMEFFIENSLKRFRSKIGYTNQRDLNDERIKEIMYYSVKQRQKEIIDMIT